MPATGGSRWTRVAGSSREPARRRCRAPGREDRRAPLFGELAYGHPIPAEAPVTTALPPLLVLTPVYFSAPLVISRELRRRDESQHETEDQVDDDHEGVGARLRPAGMKLASIMTTLTIHSRSP